MFHMQGDLAVMDRTIARAGFLHAATAPPAGLSPGPSAPIYRGGDAALSPESREFIEGLNRADIVGDLGQISAKLGMTLSEVLRGISTSTSNLPIRENLEAEARLLVPTDTPVRNLLPRTMGSGLASLWRLITSLGGGWGTSVDQPGGLSYIRSFYSETIAGSQAPAEHTTVYTPRTAAYKLLGTFGSITGFSIAAGANFQNQIAVEKTNALLNLMLNEEFALIHGVSTGTDAFGNAATAPPWGDGTNALAFAGLHASIATANGTPATHIQTGVGPLTQSHIDAQLGRIWVNGGKGLYMLLNQQEIHSLVHLAEASGSLIRIQASQGNRATLGLSITGYVHPTSGEVVDIYASRMLKAGEMIFGARQLPDGSPAADVNVLPQVMLPELAPNESVQGYTAQELAPSVQAPQVYPFIITVFETFRLKGGTVFAKSSDVTAV